MGQLQSWQVWQAGSAAVAHLLPEWCCKLAEGLPEAHLAQSRYPLQLIRYPHHDGEVALYAA